MVALTARAISLTLVAVLLLPMAMTQATPQEDPVVVAVLDTGIDPGHETFGPGQVVAWYDFTLPGGPDAPQVLWDDRVDPYDGHGHGTAVAAMVAGSSSSQTTSFAPGVDLAIARFSGGPLPDCNEWCLLNRAIDWATQVVEADVISISYYGFNPTPGYNFLGTYALTWNNLDDKLMEARAHGVLPVVLAGNLAPVGACHQPIVGGLTPQHVTRSVLLDCGAPIVSTLNAPGYSPSALVVGGDEGMPTGARRTAMEPEVTASYWVQAPSPECSTCYWTWGGTSFATPIVSGMAANLIQVARANGLADPTPDRLEHLLKWAAYDDPLAPPTLEGYGNLDADELELAKSHLLAGSTPNASDPVKSTSAIWVDCIQGTTRQIWAVGTFNPLAPIC